MRAGAARSTRTRTRVPRRAASTCCRWPSAGPGPRPSPSQRLVPRRNGRAVRWRCRWGTTGQRTSRSSDGMGQYRLPLDVQRVPRTTPPPPLAGTDPHRRRPRGTQLELPLDPFKGNRPTRSGQYPLPLDGVRRVPRPASPPPPSTPPTRTSSRGRVVQPELPFDPFKGNRPTRSGQYPLPLDGVRRAPKPAPPPPSASPASSAASRPASRQLRLPLDLPKPAKPRPGHTPRQGGKTP
jgi:hypothetical protein